MIKNLLKPKYIFMALGFVLAIEAFFAIRMFLGTPAPKPPNIQPIGDAKITLDVRKNEYSTGESITVAIRLSTGGRSVEGADVILKYNPAILEATSGAILKGHLFAEYPVLNVNNQEGIVTIAGITGVRQKSFNGSGLFASVYFKPVAPGQAEITALYGPNQTTDSNVVEAQTAKDILGQVSNLNINIK